MKKTTEFGLIALIFLSNIFLVKADVILPAIIGSNMVMQQNQKVKIWGWADKNEKIKISPSWLKDEFIICAGDDGKWLVEIWTLKAGGPHSLKIEGENLLVLENIMFGEVWICSGQSNMTFSIEMLGGWDSENFMSDKNDFINNDYSTVRLFDVEQDTSSIPLDNLEGVWEISTLEGVENFSAVAWFFGRELSRKLNVPVGLITSDWRGTSAQAWTNSEAIRANPDLEYYRNLIENIPWRKKNTRITNGLPGILYNAMIHPLLNYSIKGVIWYQGEKNCPDANHYHRLFPAMIRSWREDFKQGDFPFFYVQIAPYSYREPINSAFLREAQFMNLCYSRNTGMAVTLDIGNPEDIHPINKQDVGKRLAMIAFGKTYGYSEQVYSGPSFKMMDIVTIPENTAVNGIRLHFNNVHSGLVIKKGDVNSFIIAGSDKQFLPANIIIEDETIIVWNDEIAEPIAVRYAFTNTPDARLFNKEGLPASSFRTDDWPVLKNY